MSKRFSDRYLEIADSVGIGLFQRFSINEASLFLRCQTKDIEKFVRDGDIGFINVPNAEVCFFGFQLLEYLLEQTTEKTTTSPEPTADLPERIMRIQEVVDLTGLSRTTIWRKERAGEFPARVRLGENSVGWRAGEVNRWISHA